MVNQVNSDSMWSYITTLSSYQRYSYEKNDTVCRYWLYSFFKRLGFDTVYYQTSAITRMPNVIAELRGDSIPDSICVLGAHYDVYANHAPGADDNASGTAGVLEIARSIASHHFRKTIRFICFSAEEIDGGGSHYYVQHSVKLGEKNFAMVNLDMISHSATGSEPPVFYVAYNTLSQTLFERMKQVMENYVAGASWIDGSSFQYASASDHASFWEAGIPAIFLNDCLDNNSPNFNHFFHTASDVMGTSVNNKPLAEAILRTAAALIAELAVVAPYPAFTSENEMTFSVYPNPVRDCLILSFRPGLSDIRILDLFGRTLLQIDPQNSSNITISAKHLRPGMYFLHALADGRTLKRVIVKQ
ncbi:MAG: M20/M25/M40 family metallo-hydrolase [Bacteroidetes bacterium]|nr:M20/M25/M40 family metallo-hydrolase [Bacteroidota bacterium]